MSSPCLPTWMIHATVYPGAIGCGLFSITTTITTRSGWESVRG